jgi:hypothetical protein
VSHWCSAKRCIFILNTKTHNLKTKGWERHVSVYLAWFSYPATQLNTDVGVVVNVYGRCS